jgi:hypothetical protein
MQWLRWSILLTILLVLAYLSTRSEPTRQNPADEPGDVQAAAGGSESVDACFRTLPASGQITSYGGGSDGDLKAGGALLYRDNGDGTLSDLNTGLMWEKKDDYDNSDVNCTTTAACPNPHDADHRYLWSSGGEPFDGPLATVFLEQLNNRCDKDTSVSCTTDADCGAAGGRCGFAGHRDWRVPNWKELLSIVDYERLTPSIAPAFNEACTGSCTVATCSCTAPNVYWTSSNYLEDESWAGYISFYDGNLHADTKSHAFFARAVRGGSPASAGACARHLPATGQMRSYGAGSDGDVQAGGALRYEDNGDGTITDLNTGLVWEKKWAFMNKHVHCASAVDCPNPHDGDNHYTWGSGEDFDGTIVTVFLEQLNNGCDANPAVACATDADCAAAGGKCGFTGHRDWRIPNVKELQSIVSYAVLSPSVDEAFNRSCTNECARTECSCSGFADYWTSTTYQGDPTWAVFVGFFNGNIYAEDKSQSFYARAVRGGR